MAPQKTKRGKIHTTLQSLTADLEELERRRAEDNPDDLLRQRCDRVLAVLDGISKVVDKFETSCDRVVGELSQDICDLIRWSKDDLGILKWKNNVMTHVPPPSAASSSSSSPCCAGN